MHERSRRAVLEACDGPGTTVDRRTRQGFGGQEIRAEILHEGDAEPVAVGPLDQAQGAPAAAAEPRRALTDAAPADEAGGREHDAERASTP